MNRFKILPSAQFWKLYFWYRVGIYLFTILIYARLTTLGDTERYLHGEFLSNLFINSTSLMTSIGGIIGNLTFHNMLLGNLPCMLASFKVIKWAIEKTGLRKSIPSILLFSLLCLPNFCIWTTIFSKEFVGLVISAIFGVLFYRFFNGEYKFGWRDYIAIYLCLLFKPQYLPFILQGLAYIYISKKWLRSASSRASCALIIFSINIVVVIALSQIINNLASMMYIHFNVEGTSTRPNIFIEEGDFFRHLPLGIIIAFLGPTIGEMLKSPLMLIAGVESLFMLALFIILSARVLLRLLNSGRLSPVPFFAILITTLGILFIHYPFGIFNPGSAIRYRTNFVFLFIMLLCYLYTYKKYNRENHLL